MEFKGRQTIFLKVGGEEPSPHLSKKKKGNTWEMSKLMEQSAKMAIEDPNLQLS